jgi:hypothetical protein
MGEMWQSLTHHAGIDVVFEVEIRAKFARQDDEQAERNIGPLGRFRVRQTDADVLIKQVSKSYQINIR